MKLHAVLVLGGLLANAAGCVANDDDDDAAEATTATSTSDLDSIVTRHVDPRNRLPNHVPMFDDTGVFTTVSSQGFIDLGNPFFQPIRIRPCSSSML
jgi:hypothetical protein